METRKTSSDNFDAPPWHQQMLSSRREVRITRQEAFSSWFRVGFIAKRQVVWGYMPALHGLTARAVDNHSRIPTDKNTERKWQS
jgi:hypothetical protein